MFENIGGKVKGLAAFMCILGIIGSIIVGVVLMCNDAVGSGFAALIIGSLFSWIGSWVTYCIGEAQENAEKACAKAESAYSQVSAFKSMTKKDLVIISKQIAALEKMQKELLEELKKEKAE